VANVHVSHDIAKPGLGCALVTGDHGFLAHLSS
jgi:hypothetical protein